jgi:hypothetical protein
VERKAGLPVHAAYPKGHAHVLRERNA